MYLGFEVIEVLGEMIQFNVPNLIPFYVPRIFGGNDAIWRAYFSNGWEKTTDELSNGRMGIVQGAESFFQCPRFRPGK